MLCPSIKQYHVSFSLLVFIFVSSSNEQTHTAHTKTLMDTKNSEASILLQLSTPYIHAHLLSPVVPTAVTQLFLRWLRPHGVRDRLVWKKLFDLFGQIQIPQMPRVSSYFLHNWLLNELKSWTTRHQQRSPWNDYLSSALAEARSRLCINTDFCDKSHMLKRLPSSASLSSKRFSKLETGNHLPPSGPLKWCGSRNDLSETHSRLYRRRFSYLEAL